METSVSEVCWKIICAKHDEQVARQERERLELRLLDMLGESASKVEGTTTIVRDGYKVKVESKLKRKLDLDAYNALDLPENLQFVRYKPEIDLKRMRAVEMVDSALVASVVTTAPAKTAITIEEVE